MPILVQYAIDIVLAGYMAWETFRASRRYALLKQEIASGDTTARARFYREILVFEWVTALLALAALGFDWNKLNPKLLALNNSVFLPLSHGGHVDHDALTGLFYGIALGTVGAVVAAFVAKRRSADAPPPRASALSKLIPDFSAMLPTTASERLLWVAISASAGICEEIVFRGWLLSTLHGPLVLSGLALIVAAVAIFGLAHAYQGVSGVLLTGLAGLLFCWLYIATGSLLAPILLHIIVDIRFAFLPTSPIRVPRLA